MKKILIATDFSNASKNASQYAIELAKISGAKIILYNVYIPHAPINEGIALEFVQDKKNRNRQLLESEAVFLRKYGIEVEVLVNESERMSEILSIEKSRNVDLVVVGIQESEVLTGFTFANMITDLIKETIVPLIIIPEKSIFKKIERMAFAVDFNLETELEMHKPIKDLLQLFNPQIFILNVVKENEEIRPDKKVSEHNIEKYFENIEHIYSFIQHNDVANGLKEFISQNNIDLITMIPHKHNLFQNIFFESKTKQMVFNTKIPLIIFPVSN